MALLYVYEAKGDPADLIAKYEQAGQAFADKAEKLKGRGAAPAVDVIAHFCVETPDGISIFDLIESPDDQEGPGQAGRRLAKGRAVGWFEEHGLVDETQRQAVRDAGLVDVDYSEVTYRVHDYTVLKAGTSRGRPA